MPLNSEAVSLLRERYGYLRTEILQRLDNRYKVMTALMTIIAAGFTVIFQLGWDAIAFPICVTMLAFALGLKGDNHRIKVISDYLICLEHVLDKYYNLEINGWERKLRSDRFDKSSATAQQTIAACGFGVFFYLVFEFIAVRWAFTWLGKKSGFGGWPTALALAIAGLIPVLLLLISFWYDYKEFYATKPPSPEKDCE